MTSKERMLIALERGKPDRLPVTVHQWQKYHLDTYLGGITDLEAFEYFGMDAAIQYFQDMGQFWLPDADFAKFSTPTWRDEVTVISDDPDNRIYHHTVYTPEGVLTYKTAGNRKTNWITEYLIKRDEDIYLIKKYMPVPRLDPKPVNELYDKIGDRGILRGFVWGERAGCWQHAACLMDINELILRTFDKPDWVHELLRILLEKKLQFIESMKGAKFDLVETGGAASSTVISPKIHEEFCLPYDRKLHDALHDLGFKVVYHTCGGTKGIEEFIVANGADASETLAPVSIGGNQEPWEFKEKIGNRLALIGGMDQHNVLTVGTPEEIRSVVFTLFEKVGKDGGYILSCADHFFDTPPENLRIYAEAKPPFAKARVSHSCKGAEPPIHRNNHTGHKTRGRREKPENGAQKIPWFAKPSTGCVGKNRLSTRSQGPIFVVEQVVILPGNEKSWSKSIHPHFRGELSGNVHCQPLGKIRHRCFRRGVPNNSRQRAKGSHGRKMNDIPTLLLIHHDAGKNLGWDNGASKKIQTDNLFEDLKG